MKERQKYVKVKEKYEVEEGRISKRKRWEERGE